MSSPWVDGHISVRSRNCAEAMVNNTFPKRNSTCTSLLHIFRTVFFRSNNINTTLKHRIIEAAYLPLSVLYKLFTSLILTTDWLSFGALFFMSKYSYFFRHDNRFWRHNLLARVSIICRYCDKPLVALETWNKLFSLFSNLKFYKLEVWLLIEPLVSDRCIKEIHFFFRHFYFF